jgi:hypothetical protein
MVYLMFVFIYLDVKLTIFTCKLRLQTLLSMTFNSLIGSRIGMAVTSLHAVQFHHNWPLDFWDEQCHKILVSFVSKNI